MSLESRIYYEVDNTQLQAAVVASDINPLNFYRYLVATPGESNVSADETRVIYKAKNQACADILEAAANANSVDFWKITEEDAAIRVATDFWLGL